VARLKPSALRAARLQWLRDHREAWAGWQGHNDSRKKALVLAMKRDGVVAPSTYWPDVDITAAIQQVQRQLREEKR